MYKNLIYKYTFIIGDYFTGNNVRYWYEFLNNSQYWLSEKLNEFTNRQLRKLLRLIAEPLQLIYFAFKYRPGIINGYQILPKAYYTVIASLLTGSKSIVSSVGVLPEIQTYLPLHGLFERINIATLKLSDIVTTKGSVVTNYLISKGIKTEKIFTFNGTINTEYYTNIGAERNIDIIYVGSLIEDKGPDRFIKIVAKVADKVNDLKVAILGEGVLHSDIEKEIKSLGLQNVVTMYGFCENTIDYFRRAKILLMPSRSEGLPTAMIEAMACGCVPIISEVGCVTEAAKNNINALVIKDYLDIDGYAHETIKTIKSENEWRRLSFNATTFVNTHYSISYQAKIFKDILLKNNYV